MRWIRAVAREIVGLFVDDGWFAGAIVVWVGVCVWVLRGVDAWWAGVALGVGLMGILVESVVRFARRG